MGLRSMIPLLGAYLIACTGSIESSSNPGDRSEDDNRADEDDQAPVDEAQLNRIPGQPLRCDADSQAPMGQTPLVRLSRLQYLNTLRDLVNPLRLDALPALPPDTLRPGFAPADAFAAEGPVTDTQSIIAENVGQLVAAGLKQLGLEGCPPGNQVEEAACMQRFIDTFVTRAYRRPVTDDERDRIQSLYQEARARGSFMDAIATVVEGVLQTPQFLYRLEFGGDATDGDVKLAGHEIASRLSYLLWNTSPDDELLEAARAGALDDRNGITTQVDRMLRDTRAAAMVPDFLAAWMNLDLILPRALAGAKDATGFSGYDDAVAAALLQGLEKFTTDSLIGPGGGIRKLLSSQKAWINNRTAAIHGAPPPESDELVEVELDPGRRLGLLTQPALLAGLAGPRKHSPVLRGVLVLEKLLCQQLPPPPDDVVPQEPEANGTVKQTTRERLVMEHEGQGAACQGCHKLIDGAGFAFENYDAFGRWQDEEDGLPIDSSANLSGTFDADGSFSSAIEMITKLAPSEQVAQCFVEHFYRYAIARNIVEADGCTVAQLTNRVVSSDDDFRDLAEGLTTSQVFRYRSPFDM